ncbi:small subunit ribosomal protein S14 [Ereboglobus sp. PH5-5]|uniref:30S ribosomal protein S14 n=1 Tax=unclassified Ereboglobus TaxID=2626932 RepID=UPI002406B75D|nr:MULTISPECIES: 30S ribosomal protein S14 [unclassified Ereboglobus]MDF9826306.1 small subunit ribosomal protein S14 [Ereboglobus sp. PH5-10]MDF9833894.1 small subunit ribosomal protein S14 [Ereboglobus sp. PH5-5]
MPKTSAIERNKKRIAMTEKYKARRAELKALIANPDTPEEEFYAAQKKLQKLPRNSSSVRIRNRCALSGRPRAYNRKYGVSRIQFRELALAGKIPGVTKSSW